MNYAPALSHIPFGKLLKYCGMVLACATILPELVMALLSPQHDLFRLIEWIGVTFGLIMLVLWSIRLSQHESAQPEVVYRGAISSYPPPAPAYSDLAPSPSFAPSSPEPIPSSPHEKYQDEHSVQCFRLAKGNELVARSQDAFDLDNDLRRYAVTDGVSRSFLPSSWASILSMHFVHQGQDFEDEAHLAEWLRVCKNEWEQHAQQWIAQAEKRRQEQGLINATDWQQYMTQGAQATLIGCALSPAPTQKNGTIHIQVTAIGDANFFLVRPTRNGTWDYLAHPYTDPTAFGTTPDALATAAVASSKGMQRTWNWINHYSCDGQRGDYMLLATDAIAKWLLQQLQSRQEDWLCLLNPNTSSSAFAHLVSMERAIGHLEDDDVTILVVPL
jgi:hypothetical protein